MQSITVKAPGRINLIGEHTDYNNGFVLPAAIQKAATVTITKRADDEMHITALDLNETLVIDSLAGLKQQAINSWTNYVVGVIVQFAKIQKFPTGFDIALTSNVPIGAGLSSSAAIECAVAYGLNALFSFGIDKMDLVYMAQKAEHEFAGVQCGIMDQFAIMFGQKDQVVLLDCATMEYQYFPLLLQDYQIVLLDTGVKHALASSEYNTRRLECEAGVQLIAAQYPQVQSLRAATLDMLNATVNEQENPIVYKRCKYVIEEIERTQLATEDLKMHQLKAFGAKMFATHQGLSKLYEVSCPELDILVNAVKDNENVIGARMMGGGFGGCTINIIKTQAVPNIIKDLEQQYLATTGKPLQHYIVNIEEGAAIL